MCYAKFHMRFNKLHVCFVKLHLFYSCFARPFFFLLNYTEVVSENMHLVKYLHFSTEAYCCHMSEIEKDR